jgi:hypothetical protein
MQAHTQNRVSVYTVVDEFSDSGSSSSGNFTSVSGDIVIAVVAVVVVAGYGQRIFEN